MSLLPQSGRHQDAPSKGARFQPLNQAEVGFSRSRFFAHPYAKHNLSFRSRIECGIDSGGNPVTRFAGSPPARVEDPVLAGDDGKGGANRNTNQWIWTSVQVYVQTHILCSRRCINIIASNRLLHLIFSPRIGRTYPGPPPEVEGLVVTKVI